jgi:2-polyprenyl-3-methyl-5-hydroxy-6-metoxy-1,4-benzoquinol methylase
MKDNQQNQGSRDLERYAQDYSALQYEEIQEDYRRAELAATIRGISTTHLVEVGCGRRSVITEITNFESATIIEPIKDLLNRNLEMLEDNAKTEGFNGLLNEFVSQSNKTYDLCVLSSLLHEVNNQIEMLGNCWKLLDVKGVLIVNVPNAFSIHRILGVHMGKLDSVYSLTETQLRMQQVNDPFSKETLRNLLEDNGFEIEKMFTVIPKLLDHVSLSQIMSSGLIDREFLGNLNKLAGKLDGFGSEIIAIARKIG